MLHRPESLNVHPTRLLLPPDEPRPVHVDELMVPLVQAVWAHGLRTLGSCQDLAESVTGGNYTIYPQVSDAADHAELYCGLAWLKLPNPDGLLLLKILATDRTLAKRMRWLGEPDAWSCFTQIRTDYDGVVQVGLPVEVRFPAGQIDHVVAVLSAQKGKRDG